MDNHHGSPDPLLQTLDLLAADPALQPQTRIAAAAAARELRAWRAAGAGVARCGSASTGLQTKIRVDVLDPTTVRPDERYAERGALAVAFDRLCALTSALTAARDAHA